MKAMKIFLCIAFVFLSLNLPANETDELRTKKSITEEVSKQEYSERQINQFQQLEQYESYRPSSFSDANRNPLNNTPKRYKFDVTD